MKSRLLYHENVNKFSNIRDKEEYFTNVHIWADVVRPEFVFHEDQKSLEKQKEKRKNMIKLEKLAIQTCNNQTKNIINWFLIQNFCNILTVS